MATAHRTKPQLLEGGNEVKGAGRGDTAAVLMHAIKQLDDRTKNRKLAHGPLIPSHRVDRIVLLILQQNSLSYYCCPLRTKSAVIIIPIIQNT